MIIRPWIQHGVVGETNAAITKPPPQEDLFFALVSFPECLRVVPINSSHPPTPPRQDAASTKRPQRSGAIFLFSLGLARLASTCAPSHPPTPRRAETRRVPTSTAYERSFQARSCFLVGRGWIDLLLRAWTSTATLIIRLVWCARSASKGDQPAHTPPPFPVCRVPRAQEADGPALFFLHPGGVPGRAVIGNRTRNLLIPLLTVG